MPTPMIIELIKQLVRKPATNIFPIKHIPKSVTLLLDKISKVGAKINPPVELPPNFRGKITYEREKCIGCKLCITVCPARAIEMKEEEKKIKIYVARCIHCSQCNEVCPVKCLHMSDKFLNSAYEKFSKEEGMIVE